MGLSPVNYVFVYQLPLDGRSDQCLSINIWWSRISIEITAMNAQETFGIQVNPTSVRFSFDQIELLEQKIVKMVKINITANYILV